MWLETYDLRNNGDCRDVWVAVSRQPGCLICRVYYTSRSTGCFICETDVIWRS